MYRVASHLVLTSLLLCICSCDSDSTPGPTPIPEECKQASQGVNDAVATVSAVIDLVLGGEPPAGITFKEVVPKSEATITFGSYLDKATGYTVDGVLTLRNSVSGTTATLVVTGELQLQGGEVSTLRWDATATLPWDPKEEDFAGDPTRVDGTIRADALECPAATWLDFEDPKGNGSVDPSFVTAGMQGVVVYSKDGSSWGYPNVTEADATGTSEDLRAIACRETRRCVAVGEKGVIITSDDGVSWSVVSAPSSQSLHEVVFGSGRWVIAGAGGTLLTSSDDGKSWTAASSGTTEDLVAGAYAGRFVVVSREGTVLHSSDGLQWQPAASGPPRRAYTDLATDGQGSWVLVGDAGSIITSSAPEQSWKTVDAGIQEHFSGVAYGSGRFILVGQGAMGWGPSTPPVIYLSSDRGQSFSAKTVPGELASTGRPLCSVATDGAGRWVAAGCGGDFLLSTDNGESWSATALDTYGQFDIAFR